MTAVSYPSIISSTILGYYGEDSTSAASTQSTEQVRKKEGSQKTIIERLQEVFKVSLLDEIYSEQAERYERNRTYRLEYFFLVNLCSSLSNTIIDYLDSFPDEEISQLLEDIFREMSLKGDFDKRSEFAKEGRHFRLVASALRVNVNDFYHSMRTRNFMTQGIKELRFRNIVVCGAQLLNDEFVEPLDTLVERCDDRLFIVDSDRTTLNVVCKRLKSRKVVPIKFDLSGGAIDALADFFADLLLNNYSVTDMKIKLQKFYAKLLDIAKTNRIALSEMLGSDITKGDLVISSLVGSQLSRTDVDIRIFLMKYFPKSILHEINASIDSRAFELIAAFNMKHVFDLHAWTNPNGMLYYANDESACELDYGRWGTIEVQPCLSVGGSAPFDYLRRISVTREEQRWHWLHGKEKMHCSNITAVICKGVVK